MVVEYKPLFIETEEEFNRDRLIPAWQAVAPFPIVEDAVPDVIKAPDPSFARFHKLLPNVRSLASSIVEDDFDYTKALVVESSVDQLVDWAPNVLVFVSDPRFLGMKPYAKQAEMLVRLFEEWCPMCSNPDWFLHGFPTAASWEEIERNCAMLEFGVCPHCKYTKKDGRLSSVFHDPDELVAVIGQRAGKCLSGDSEFFDGEKRRLVGEVINTDFLALTKTHDHNITYRPATAFASGEKDTMKLTLDEGSALTLSYDHRVYTPHGWVEAGRLKVGDLVATPRSIPEPEKTLDVSDDEVVLAAYLLSDGGVAGDSTRFTNATPSVVADFTAVANRLADGTKNNTGGGKLTKEDEAVAHALHAEGSSQTEIAEVLGATQPTISRLLSGKSGKKRQKEGVKKEERYAYIARGLSWFRRKWDINGLAKHKRVPAEFWGLSNRQIALFLNRFWACDGYVTRDNVGVTLASEKMIDDLKFLLRRLGIRASKKYRVAKCQTGSFDAWRLTAYGRDALRFLEVVGPVLGKEEACVEVADVLVSAKSRNTTYDVVPIARPQIVEMADEVYEKTGKKCRSEMREFSSAKPTGHISRDMLARICAKFEYDGKYAWMKDADLVWEAVAATTPVGTIPVFDLSVPATECFIANNMVVHNSAVTSMGVSYLTHINCMLHTPWKTYGLTPGQVIDFTMVAVTVGQSEKALWSNFKQMLSQSYWFRKYKEVCDDYGQKQGVSETIRVNETFFKFRHKGIELHNASNNNKALRGATRFGFAIDELAFFDDDAKSGKTRGNGAETYTSLNNSLASLRQKAADVVLAKPGSTIPNALGFCVSSPRAMNDAIMQLYRDRKSDKKAVAMHLPTWDMNPNFPRHSKVVAGMLKQQNGWRDFGARPPLTDNPLVEKGGIIEDAFKSALATDPTYGLILSPSVVAHQDELRIVNGRNVQTTAIGVIDEEYKPPKPKAISAKALAALGPHRALYEELLAKPALLRPHVLGIDMGTSNNSFALVASYLSDDGILITDFALEVKGSARTRVNIAHIFDNVIVPLIEKMNIVGVFYDQWNSLHHIQALTNLKGALGPLNSSHEVRKWKNDLRKEGELPPFVADQVRLTMADANLLVARLEQGDILFPKMERPMFDLVQDSRLDKSLTPYTHLALQFSTVRVSANGSQLRKPADNGDDDIFRAWAVSATMAFTDETVMALLKGDSKKAAAVNPDSAPLGYVSVGNAGRGVRRIPPGTTGSTSLVVRRSGNAGGGFGFGGKR